MTGNDLYLRAVNLLGEDVAKSDFYKTFAPGCLNQLMINALREQNSMLVSRGLEPLACAPAVKTLEEEIPFDQGLAWECFPYGLAALLVAEDDKNKFNWLIFEFENRLKAYNKAEFTAIGEMC